MFAARTCIVAAYEADRQVELVPVEAWGDDGVPYVLGPGGLIPAALRPGPVLIDVRYRDVAAEVGMVTKAEYVKEPTPVPIPVEEGR